MRFLHVYLEERFPHLQDVHDDVGFWAHCASAGPATTSGLCPGNLPFVDFSTPVDDPPAAHL